MKLARKLLAIALSLGLLAQGPAEAATFYYYRGAGGSGSGQPTGTPPASPAAPGVFAILVDAPSPNVAFLGDAYNATTYAYSNVGQVVYSLKSGSLPPGISFSPATGTIAGSATSMGSFSAVVQGLDSATGKTATASVQIDSVTTPSISGNPSAYAAVGLPYSATFTFAGGTQPYTFSIASLPPGLTLNPSATTATLAGTPTVAGTYPVAVVGTEAHGLGVQYPYSLTVAGPVSISGMPPSTGTVGIPYSGQLAVSGGAAPYTFSLAAGTLPLGVTLKPGTGVISGTPTTAGTKSGIKIKVTDAAGQSATSAPFAIAISSTGPQTLTISGTPPATGVEGTAYSSQFTAGGGSGSGYVYSLTGTLPAGLSLNPATGLLSGTPAAGTAGSYPGLTVSVVDNASHTASTSAFTLTIGTAPVPLAIAGNPPSSTQQGDAYVAKFTGTGGSGGGYVYTLAGAALPPGLTLNSATGLISGTATTVGTYSGIVVQVRDSASHIAVSAPFAIAVGAPAPLAISGSPAPSVNQNAAYVATWTGFDGSGSGYHFTSVGAALPPGLSLSDVNGVQGELSGTATVPGTYSGLRIQVQDSAGSTALSPAFSIQVVPTALPTAPLSIAGTAGPADLDVAYSAQFSANGGAGGYAYSLGAGALPPGLSLDPITGQIAGTPSATGTYGGIVVTVADTASATASTAPFSIVVTDPNPLSIAFNPQTNWQVDDFVAESASATGGDAVSYSFSAIGTLPPGLTLFSSGTLFGTLSQAGTFGPFRIQVTDGVRTAITAPVTFSVANPGLFVSGFPSGSATVGSAYSAQFSAQGGSGAGYAYSMVGTLPAGLSLDPVSGLISGVPTATGTYSGLAVQVTDSAAASAVSAGFSIAVSAAIPPLAVSGSPSGSATLAQAYSAQFSASGGSGTGYVYTMVGTLPAGLSLNSSSGLISGSPTAVGTYSGLRVKATDSASASATSTAFSIVVSAPSATLTLAGFQNPSAQVGTPYTAQFTASGGVQPYVYSLIGTLPAGLSLNPSTGYLSGTPTVAGTYSGLRVQVADQASGTAITPPFSIVVAAAPAALSVSGSPPSTGTVGVAYSGQFTASGGSGSGYVYSMLGTLPAGLTLNPSTGAITGSPTTAGSYSNLKVQVADSASATAFSATFSITVSAAASTLSVSGSAPATATVGTAYSAQYTASGGSGSGYVYAMVGTLPAGLSLNPSTGAITGTPTAAGTVSGLKVQATDSASATATSAAFSIAVAAAPVALSVSGPVPGIATVGISYSGQFTASGGSGSGYVYSMIGTLPAGLSLNPATGAISGAPTTAGVASGLKVQVVDSAAGTATSSFFSISVQAAGSGLGISRTAALDMMIGKPYAGLWTAFGGAGGYVYTITSGTLPAGLSLNSATGAVTGTPTTLGTSSGIVMTVTDSASASTSTQFDMKVWPSTLTLTGSMPSSATVGVFYSGQYVAIGGAGGAGYSISGTLPPGLTFNANGSISGTPTTAGVYPGIVFTATDNVGATGTVGPFTIAVANPASVLAITGSPALWGTSGASYTAQFTATGGVGTYTYSMIGTLPPGLSLDPATGLISGVLGGTVGTTYTGLAVKVTDSAGSFATSAGFYITPMSSSANVMQVPTPQYAFLSTSAQATYPYSYDPQLQARGFTHIVTSTDFSVQDELTVNTVGAIGGSTWFTGTRSWSYTATGPDGKSYVSPPLKAQVRSRAAAYLNYNTFESPNGYKLPNANLGNPYSTNAGGVSGGSGAPYGSGSWTNNLNSADLASFGLKVTIDPNYGYLMVTGTPTKAGLWKGTLCGTDSYGYGACTSGVVIHVNAALTLVGTASPGGQVGQSYSSQFTASGGGGPGYTYRVVGTLPPGIAMNATTGTLSGTPTTAGIYPNIVVEAVDGTGTASGGSVARVGPFQITIQAVPALGISGGAPATAYTQSGYSAQFSGTGGSGAGYVYAMIGSLPPGLSLNTSTGLISGVPTTVGTYSNLQVKVTDSASKTATSAAFSITISPLPLSVTGSAGSATIGAGYSAQFSAAGGSGSGYTYSMIGALPAGLSLNGATGKITGTATTLGTSSGLQVKVTDSASSTATTTAFSIAVINPPPPSEALIASVTGGWDPVGPNGTTIQAETAGPDGNPDTGMYVEISRAMPLVIKYSQPVAATGASTSFYCPFSNYANKGYYYTVDSSDDGVNWTTRASGSYVSPMSCPAKMGGGLGSFTPATAQYWRVATTLNDPSYWVAVDWFRMQ